VTGSGLSKEQENFRREEEEKSRTSTLKGRAGKARVKKIGKKITKASPAGEALGNLKWARKGRNKLSCKSKRGESRRSWETPKLVKEKKGYKTTGGEKRNWTVRGNYSPPRARDNFFPKGSQKCPPGFSTNLEGQRA